MSDVKRYDIADYSGGMDEIVDGAYVSADDYDKLKAENESLRKDAERLDWVLANCDLGGPPYLDSREEIDEEMASGSNNDSPENP
jgi:hypothetical protein